MPRRIIPPQCNDSSKISASLCFGNQSPTISHPLLPLTNADLSEVASLRTDLSSFFYVSPKRWKFAGDVYFSFFVLVLKVIIVTFQLLLFGSLSLARVSYGDRAQVAFSHLYLRNWDPQYETLPYPPSTGVYGLYTQNDFFEALGFALRQYNQTDLISLNGYTFSDANRSIKACVAQLDPLFHSEVNSVCKTFHLVDVSKTEFSDRNHTKAFFDSKGLNMSFSRLQTLSINFLLDSPPIRHTDWDRSIECFQFDVYIVFDNRGLTGQVVVTLTSVPLEVVCSLSEGVLQEEEPREASLVRRITHLMVDIVAFNVSLVSLALSGLSLYRATRLWKRTVQFFSVHYDKHLTGLLFDFVNPWLFVGMTGDFFIIGGSISKLVHNKDILKAYIELSYLLGLGTFFIWISALRYVGLSSQTHLLLRTIRRSVPGLFRFCACALVLYFSFVFPAWVILGPYNRKFRSFTSTLECLFSLINGDDMYVTFSIIDATKGMGIYFFSRIFLYVFITFFIYAVLNIFVTIIFEAYEEVKAGEEIITDGMALLKRFIAQEDQTMDLERLGTSNHSGPIITTRSMATTSGRPSTSSDTVVPASTADSLVDKHSVHTNHEFQSDVDLIYFEGYGEIERGKECQD